MRLTLLNSKSEILTFLSLVLNLFLLQISINLEGVKQFDTGHWKPSVEILKTSSSELLAKIFFFYHKFIIYMQVKP